jgi:hypothetical protein
MTIATSMCPLPRPEVPHTYVVFDLIITSNAMFSVTQPAVK